MFESQSQIEMFDSQWKEKANLGKFLCLFFGSCFLLYQDFRIT